MSRNKLLIVSAAIVIAIILAVTQFMKQDETASTSADQKQGGQTAVHISQQVEKSCMSCHAVDGNGKLARIEYVRKTPEGWSQTIARMERLHGVQLTNDEREQIIADLSRERGLAPEEAEQVQYWLANKPSYTEADPQNPSVANACITCHAGARFMAQRRTEEEWKNLKDFHLVMFPSIYLNHRHMDWPKEADAVLAYLAKEYPEDTQEWKDWKGKEHDVAGKWKVAGFQGTKGFYIGESEFKQKDKGFTETKSIRFLKDKSKATMQGDVQMFSGYMVRAHYLQGDKKLNGTHNLTRAGNVMNGDWSQLTDGGITGEETYYRWQTEKPEIIHMEPQALKKGTKSQVTLYGMNLAKLKAADLKLPAGVSVNNLEAKSDEQVQLTVTVGASAQSGSFALQSEQAKVHKELVVYDKVDYLKATPAYAIARMGGAGPMNKVSTQFVAYAMTNGKDGKQGTADDVTLGPVDAKWSFVAYPAGAHDEDMPYMGTLSANGLYTPRAEGVNKEREFTAENIGNVTVVAKAVIDGKPFSAQTHLVSTVPDYNNLVQ